MAATASEPWITLVGGPTAGGKSAYALALAERTGAEIVNADSMQVYAGLRVLTAGPDAADEARAPHHLYGVVDPAEPWSVGRWLRAAASCLEAIRGRGRPAIVVGGTGLYFNALTKGLAETPPVPVSAREAAAERLQALGEALFRDGLAGVDPEAERRIAPGDRQRLVRAASVHAHTGRPLTDWRADTRPVVPREAWIGVILELDRETLYARCDARAAAMISGGALDEVRRLLARGLPEDAPAMKALGVAPLAAHLRGELTLEAALERLRQDTRRYAKRQLTWFRNQAADWRRIPFTPDSTEAPH